MIEQFQNAFNTFIESELNALPYNSHEAFTKSKGKNFSLTVTNST